MNSGDRAINLNFEAVLQHLTQPELAERWRVSGRTLERWRRNGTGPAFLRLNGKVLYRLSDVLGFEQTHLKKP